MIVFTEFRWTAALALLENTVEITEVVETAAIANLGNGTRTVDQLTTSVTQTKVYDVFAKVTACMQLEKTTER